MSLGTVLVVVALLATLGLALAGGTISHHHLLLRDRHRESARNLARSVVALAIEKVTEQPEFGSPGHQDAPLQIQLQGEESDAVGLLAFGSPAGTLRLPASVNNLEKLQSEVDGRGLVVPANAVRLYGVGRSGGIEQQVQVTLVVPPFPWALVSGGQLRAEDGLEIGGLAQMPNSAAALQDLLPADIAANRDIYLGPHTHIEGDVQAAGKVELSSNQAETVSVRGEVRSGETPVEIPDLELGRFDPQLRDLAFTPLGENEYSSADPLRGSFRREGRLDVAGDLRLEGGLLYVDGDLKIQGGIRGKGMVVATGSVQVLGASDLEGSNSVALLSGGDMALRGADRERSSLQGLVYSRGNFQAESVSVLGSLVSQGEASFRDARMVSIAGSDSFQLESGAGGGLARNQKVVRLEVPGSVIPDNSSVEIPLQVSGNPKAPYFMTITHMPDRVKITIVPNPDPFQATQAPPAGGSFVQMAGAPNPLGQFEGVFSEDDLRGEAPLTMANGESVSAGGHETEGGASVTPRYFQIPRDRIRALAELTGTGPDVPAPANPGAYAGAKLDDVQFELSSVFKLKERIRLCQWQES